MASAILRLANDRSAIEVETPAGNCFESEWPADSITIIEDEDEGESYLAVIEGAATGLKANTVYRLVEVSTEVEDFEPGDDDDDGSDDDDDGSDDDGPDQGERVAA